MAETNSEDIAGLSTDLSDSTHEYDEEETELGEDQGENSQEIDGLAGPSEKIVKPLTPEALAAFHAAQKQSGVIYISRIPPGMRPAKVRHLMSAYGKIGRVYLQQEDAHRAYLRRKYTSTRKAHYTEGWVEFEDKKIARRVADMLNAQPIGGKKGSRWRDDIWTMKYLPKFKWSMLTEQVAHEAAVHAAKLRAELSQSRTEQQEYLKNVELARVLDKRAVAKKEKGQLLELKVQERPKKRTGSEGMDDVHKRPKTETETHLAGVLNSIF